MSRQAEERSDVSVRIPLSVYNALFDAFTARNPDARPEEESPEAVNDAVAEQIALLLVLGHDTAAALHSGIAALPPFRGQLLRRLLGLGCTRKQLAEIARELHMPRRRLDEVRRAALVDLRHGLAA